ncbi:glycosyltransferase family 4 protein [Bacteroides sp.]|uniref:glycosyltransferase family 4 protein n=1 Tax=Bacteroides sp. TaxID=29523 RepID=UPI00258D0A07|nr:glycosyltransferase family 4 protein [Bacteroides sp.]
MNCLLITNHFYPESFRCNDVAFELVKRGHKVTVLTGIPDYPEGKFHKGYSLFKRRRENINGVKVIRVPIIPRGNGKALRMIINYISGIFSFNFYALYLALFYKFDNIFIHDTSPAFICLPAVLIKKIRKTPIDLWILDMWPQSLVAGGINNKKIYKAIDLMMDFVYRNSSIIHISSLGFRKLLSERNVPNEKIEYLPNWSDDAITNGEDTQIPSLPEGFRIMFAGNIGEAQNMENVMKAALLLKEHKNIHWVFLGDGRKKEWVDNFVKENNLEDTVHLLGRFPINTMGSFFKRADAMLVSLTDNLVFNLTLPAKVQAYMSCSKPIVTMLNGEGKDIIEKAECGWCAGSNDYEKLASIILEISSLPKKELEAIGKNGYDYYMNNFHKDICIGRIEQSLINLS